ncbi:MAG: glycosyltransferase family 4 protein [Bacteroidales bacterium]|jgi:glycosyltransferase involved in cell wall biosynthesis|nr:glycosyltransferase family 4 protein [Bacteroidales bacterium]
MKKINLLFDISLLLLRHNKNSDRTGIFFVAYNIFRIFEQQDIFNISIYVSCEYKYMLPNIKKDTWLSSFNRIVFPNEQIPLSKIKVYKQNLKSTKNLKSKFKYLLFLCLNLISIGIYRFRTNRYSVQSKLEMIDVYFTPMYGIPNEIMKHKNIKKFIVLHDTMPLHFPEYYPDYNLPTSWFNRMIDNLDKETYCICVSQSTKNDFLYYASDKLDESRMFIAYNAASHDFKPKYNVELLIDVLTKYKIAYNNNFEYIFSFCSIEPRKNLIFTLQCFIKFIRKHDIQNLCFILGGPPWEWFNRVLEEKGIAKDYFDKIIRLGYVDDEDVNILYSHSLFFTYISQYEGFGMPPLEAMQSGTPVITSNNSSLPEVVGDAAIMIDCNSEEQCIKAFEDLYFNRKLREQYIQKGIEQGKLFSWNKTGEKIIQIMVKAITEK